MNKYFYLFIIMVVFLALPMVFKQFNINLTENFSNNNTTLATPGTYPNSIDGRLLTFYPSTNRNTISNEDSNNMWWHYPTFQVGSYKQITNNIRYPNNPDVGTCMPGSMCGALYKKKQEKSNVIEPLPPVPDCVDSVRINYYRSDPNMLTFSNYGNIMY